MATIIEPDGTQRAVLPANGATFTLKEMQTIVGGYIEVVTLDATRFMFVNEDGHAFGLPFNLFATALYRSAGGRPEYPILGTVLITNHREAGE